MLKLSFEPSNEEYHRDALHLLDCESDFYIVLLLIEDRFCADASFDVFLADLFP